MRSVQYVHLEIKSTQVEIFNEAERELSSELPLSKKNPENPRDIIVFLPSLSWTTFGCAFVGQSETKEFSLFPTFFTDYMFVLGSICGVDVHEKKNVHTTNMGWVVLS